MGEGVLSQYYNKIIALSKIARIDGELNTYTKYVIQLSATLCTLSHSLAHVQSYI